MDDSKVKHAYTTDYAQGLDDLDANRAGYIPIGQKRWLRRRWLRDQMPQMGFAAALLLTLIAIVWFMQVSPRWDDEALLLGIVLAIVLLVLIGHLIIEWRRIEAELTRGVVNNIEGRVIMRPTDGFTVSINGLDFKVTQDMYLTINNLESYRLYYTPQSKILLTAEKLNDE